jgi:hypothetical protein
MISTEHRCIFVHIPRCGGTTVESILWPGERDEADLWMGFVSEYHNKYQTGGLQHLLASQIRQEIGAGRFASYFKFSVVRNPFDRAISQFSYMKRRKDLRAFIGMSQSTSFSKYLTLIRRKRHVQWEPQCSFIYDNNGAPLTDFVGRFETLASDVRTVCARLGVEFDALPHHNASDRGPYRNYYTPESRAQIEDMYGDDLDLLGYAF